MKKRLKYIFLITALTASVISACQLYWVYFNFKTAKANFIQSANYQLQQSIDDYQLAQNKLPSSLVYKKPSLTFFMRSIPDTDPLAMDTPKTTRRFSAVFETVAVDEQHLPAMKALVARLMSQQRHKKINLDSLSLFFHRRLKREHLEEDFQFSVIRGKKVAEPGNIERVVNFYKDPVVVRAELKSPAGFFFRRNFLPAMVSTLLILLSVGCLLYMSQIIKRQSNLDRLKTDFMNNIVHELRTPLTILRSSNEAMTNFGAAADPGSLQRHLDINAQIIDSLDGNIDRILEINNPLENTQAPALEYILLEEFVCQVISRFKNGGQNQISFVADQGIPGIVGDRYMLETILNNLIDNAVKYSPAPAKVEIFARQDREYWHLQVRDSGFGIARWEIPYIFDQYYRVSTGNLHEIKGYGIGLSYVRQLTSLLRGKIEVTSTLGKGTVFTIKFPVCQI